MSQDLEYPVGTCVAIESNQSRTVYGARIYVGVVVRRVYKLVYIKWDHRSDVLYYDVDQVMSHYPLLCKNCHRYVEEHANGHCLFSPTNLET